MTVYGKETANYLQSEYLSMSSFSSWGVPGDLSLKPEISAPGGSIYSVNGGTSATDQYELMSGTSMAAPQVAGMAALVQQYLRENEITVSGLTSRALTQALLMSTSVPMRSEAGNGNYFPVFQQGSGFANVLAAVQTPVFMTVDGMPDGKVKVELGEDAAREGVYTFRFRLNNLTGEADPGRGLHRRRQVRHGGRQRPDQLRLQRRRRREPLRCAGASGLCDRREKRDPSHGQG